MKILLPMSFNKGFTVIILLLLEKPFLAGKSQWKIFISASLMQMYFLPVCYCKHSSSNNVVSFKRKYWPRSDLLWFWKIAENVKLKCVHFYHSAFFCPDSRHRPFNSWLIFIFLKSGNFSTKSASWQALGLPWWITHSLI